MSPLPHCFFFLKFLSVVGIIEIQKSWKYQALTRSASEFMTFLKNDKLMMIVGGQILHFFRYLLLKITSGLKHFPRYVFLTQETKKWHGNCPKAYWHPAIGNSYQNLSCSIYLRKRKVSRYSWVSFFFFCLDRTHSFKYYYTLDLVKK